MQIVSYSLPTISEYYSGSSAFVFKREFIEAFIILAAAIKGLGSAMYFIGGIGYLR